MLTTVRTSRDVVAARPRAQAAPAFSAGIQRRTGGAVCPLPGTAAVRADVFFPVPGSPPGGHPS